MHLKEIRDHEVSIDQDLQQRPGHLMCHPYFESYRLASPGYLYI